VARCGCGNTCSCQVEQGDGISVTGTGASGNPFVIAADAEYIRDTINAAAALGSGIDSNDAGDSLSVLPSTDPGNAIEVGSDGRLHAVGSLIDIGPGLEVTDDGLSVAGEPPENYPDGCAPETDGTPVYLGNDGRLYSESPVIVGPVISVLGGTIASQSVNAAGTYFREGAYVTGSFTNPYCVPILVRCELYSAACVLATDAVQTILNYRAAMTVAVNAAAPALSSPVSVSETNGKAEVQNGSTSIANIAIDIPRAMKATYHEVLQPGDTLNIRGRQALVADLGSGQVFARDLEMKAIVLGRAA
jgi:hypothetical protein